jgi:hypothetical protein
MEYILFNLTATIHTYYQQVQQIVVNQQFSEWQNKDNSFYYASALIIRSSLCLVPRPRRLFVKKSDVRCDCV